jgi:16S rRNA C967 or C1407 C5-methylase (RsmB/RsmF family)/NOL1/NOP2/fmu family ribosome biogenesis protein
LSLKLPSSLLHTIPSAINIDWQQLQLAHEQAAVNSVRINPGKCTDQFNGEENIPWCMNGKYLSQRPSFTFDPLFHAGTYYVQEASSMFLEYALKQVVDFNAQLQVLDLCAAPGGKSTHVASLINEDSLLISNEVIGTRVNILTENMSKWGYDNTWVSNNDPAHFKRVPHFFDVVLVDAPCSGSGLFRKIPAYCNEWNMDLVALCAQRQKRILHDMYDTLAQNGVLVYMTCSLSSDENEDMVDFIMEQFEVESCKVSGVEAMGIVETQSEIRQGYGYRFLPHLLKGEGFFLAVFRKKDGEEKEVLKVSSRVSKDSAILSAFIDQTDYFSFLQNENVIAMRRSHQDIFNYLNTRIKIVKKGILLGKQLPKELIPSHELALYKNCIYKERTVSLELQEAVAYLKKEPLHPDLAAKGWYLVCYQQFAIGWLKNLGNRINNYYPSNNRILSQNSLPV